MTFAFKDGVPWSSQFEDIYFSVADGLEESRHVFIAGNSLKEKWKNKARYVIGETGFGTGLNFLAVWQAWQQDSNRPETLHFFSLDKYPLTKAQLIESHHTFPELESLSAQLINNYPLNFTGFHRLWLDEHRICLTICFMDVTEALKQAMIKVDSWFLDGFSPAKNPEMWSRSTIRHIARLSHHQSTLSTFTSAGSVRRELVDAGFAIKKTPGYGKKREMVIGTMERAPAIRQKHSWKRQQKFFDNSATVAVIGGGIAGAQISRHLAQRGFNITLYEQHPSMAKEGSGNPRGVIAPRMTAKTSIEESFSVSCFLYMLDQLKTENKTSNSWHQSGVLHLANSERKTAQWQAIAQRQLPEDLVQTVDAGEASEISGVRLTSNALWFPLGGWVNPISLIENLIQHPQISTLKNSKALQLDRNSNCWEIRCAQCDAARFDIVINASGKHLSTIGPDQWELDLIGGQTTLASSNPQSRRLTSVVQHDGYITPAENGVHLVGATYEKPDAEIADPKDSNYQNWRQQITAIPDIDDETELSMAHHAYRVTAHNRFPLLGPVPDPEFFSNEETEHAAPYLHGLYVTGAYGSRGLTNAALCAEALACSITGEPSPLPELLGNACASDRKYFS